LVDPRNPLNIGAAARAMSNFGFPDMRLVRPYDLAFREAKSAVRSTYILEKACVYDSLAEALEGCTLVVGTTSLGHRDLHAPLYRLETAARLIREHRGGQIAILFGSEKFGLGNEDMSYCHWLTRIPTRAEHESMNLGQAVSICLYELIRDEEAAAQPEYAPSDVADAASLERLTEVMKELLAASGYSQERTAESTELKLRRLLRRLQIPSHDATVLLGMLRQVLWKLRHPPSAG
jgi:TrmH family RNA methyltransferase